MTRTVDIVLSVHNGARWLPEQLRSLQAQTYRAWRLWVRDDASTDESWEIVRRAADEDARIHTHPRDGRQLRLPGCQDWLLGHLPADAGAVMGCDADDVWLPGKIERSLQALEEAERRFPGPILVHTDLRVVDTDLVEIAPSLWDHMGARPDRATLPRILVSNVATWPTLLMNRPLLDLALPVPAGAPEQDWWLALVAVAFGRLVSVDEATVLYRRHGANAYGTLSGPLNGAADGIRRLRQGNAELKRWIDRTAAQARAFIGRFPEALSPEQLRLLGDIASIPDRGPLGRKLAVLQYHTLRERGIVRNLGLALRA